MSLEGDVDGSGSENAFWKRLSLSLNHGRGRLLGDTDSPRNGCLWQMFTRFAGARSVDQRRRRRLAQEFDEDRRIAPSPRRASSKAASAPLSSQDAQRKSVPYSIVPRSWWKVLLLAVLGFGAWGGMLWLGMSPLASQPGTEQTLSLERGLLPRVYSTIALCLASLLSCVLLQHRASSRKDFMGRYRVWGWSAMFWGMVCACSAFDLHFVAARSLLERWPLACWRPETMCWLAPLAIGVLTMYRLLGREMRHYVISESCWHLTFVLALVAGGMQLGLELWIVPPSETLVVVGVTTLWQSWIVLTLLLHARFVVHVTKEAGPKVPTRTQQIGRWVLRRVMQRRHSKRPAKQAKSKSTARSVTKPAAQPVSSAKPKPSPVRTRLEPAPGAVETSENDKKLQRRVLGQSLRVDAPQGTQPPHSSAAPITSGKPASRETTAATPAQPAVVMTSQPTLRPPLTGGDSRLSNRERKQLKKMQRLQSAK